MNVVDIKDIATLFASKVKLGDIEAEAFINSMFSVIRQGLEADRQVKIRGFGTFKIIDVEARESVSVNTGERVVIESHRKVTFTPDATMKELVNKPFSLFNTVALNDGVEFDDVDVETPPEAELQEPETDTDSQSAPVEDAEEQVEAQEEAVDDAEEAVEVAQEEVIADTDEPVVEAEEPVEDTEEPVDDTEEADNEDQSDDVLPSNRGKKVLKVVLYCLLTLVLMGASYYVGMHYGSLCADDCCIFDHEGAASESEIVAVDVRKEASEDVQKADTVKLSVPDTTAKTAVGTQKDAVSESEKAVSESKTVVAEGERQEKKTESQGSKSAEVAAMMQTAAKYADKDVRVRTGAYCIVGTDRTVTVRQGESLATLSKRELGPGMDCYIETFNDLRPDVALRAGQTVKIPKLLHKKTLRRLAK